MESLEFLQQIILTIISGVLALLGGVAIWYLRTRGQCILAMKNKIDKIDKRSWRIGKAMIIVLREIDKQTQLRHNIDPELEDLAREIMNETPDDIK